MYPSQQNATDQTANFFWLLVILAIIALAFWWFEKRYIVTAIFYIRNFELNFLKGIMFLVNTFADWFSLPQVDTNSFNHWQRFMIAADKSTIPFGQVAALSDEVGLWFRYPVIIVLLVLAAVMMFHNRSARFRHFYSMDTLRKFEAENWPQIKPILSTSLLKERLDEGPWAMAKLPIDFCKENNLLELADGPNNTKVWSLKDGPAERLFVLQMGPLWQGPQALPIHFKALLVIFVAKVERHHQVSDDLIVKISESAAKGPLDFSEVDALLLKYQDKKIIKWLANRHAYVGTLMASLLEIARIEGVLATAEFLWLKPLDRRMWYLLNSVGRQTAVVEVAGIFAHWLAEKRMKRPLKTPMVKEAVVALEADVREILYIPEEERWHTSRVA